MDGVIVPQAYVISRTASAGLVQTAIAAFSITPLSCVIISTMTDYPLAQAFDTLIIRTDSEPGSLAFAIESFTQTEMPSLVIGSRDGISAIHADGIVEDLPWTASSIVN